MDDHAAGMDFFEGFALLAGAMWIIGALLVGGLVLLGQGRVGPVSPAANQTAVADSPATQ